MVVEKLIRFYMFETAKFDRISPEAIMVALASVALLAAWPPARPLMLCFDDRVLRSAHR
jgi:hypothetical protein